ncbi:MAG: methionine synthase [Deltaproteobacteria bacterium]|nr:methionine synthase [Deltaproteobacteria bacterium]
MPRKERTARLCQRLKEHILVIDGAMGTAIQQCNLTADDFGGAHLEGCNEYLVITRPDVIQEIHENYLKAGCDIVETNTFGGTPLVLAEYGLEKKCYEINFAATQLAKAAADKFSTPDKPRFVAGSIGPTTKAISVTGGITFEELIFHFHAQLAGLWDGGADYFLIETCQDTRNIKASLLAIDKFFAEKGESIPVAISVTIEPMGTMLGGQSVEALLTSVAHRDLLYIGLNCATGPEFMTDHIRSLAELSPFAIGCVPNAGLPDEDGCYLETPAMVVNVIERFVQNGWINVLGGCCGTHAGHIQALVELAQKYKPRVASVKKRSALSGIDYLEITDEMRPVIVGERTNVIGSRKFKKLICEEKFDEASDIARAQIKNGAQIIDICLANPDRNEFEDLKNFLELAVKKIRVPLMIDSTDHNVIEMALTYCQGKALINSVNLEDGEERFEKVIPMAKKFGAALVVGCIDDDPTQGMGVTRERKLAIAERSFDLLVNKYGVAPEDIYWDPLVFPCATGDKQYVGSAAETIEGIRLIKQKFPQTKTVLGISNVSFGLPEAGREVLNSVFLYHCVQAGLDLAIVNSEKLERFSSIPDEEKKLAEDLLFNRGDDPVAAFAAQFREAKKKEPRDKSKIPLEERLATYIVEGSKDGLGSDLDEALKNKKPLEIINGPLMKGMDEVGRLFNTNQLIVAEVLQSAEAMKAAVSHLEPFMEKSDAAQRGKILLATVKGDVHDIGKNLVDIILSNNGFNVINLGIKVLPETLIAAIREHNPDIVGLSGLLVKSAQQMVLTADDFSKAGTTPPMLVGGAALSENFVDKKISEAYTGTVAYASDAMHGLDLAKTIVDPARFEQLKIDLHKRRTTKKMNAAAEAPKPKIASIENKRAAKIEILSQIPSPSDFDRHILTNTPIEIIWQYINPLMLYGKHLGIKGGVVKKLVAGLALEENESRSLEVWNAVEAVKQEYKNSDILKPSAVFQFFKAQSDANRLFLLNADEKNIATFDFPRKELCISDFVNPAGAPIDNIAMFCTTVGKGVRELAEELKIKGDYLKSIIVQVLAMESAEAYAEMLHSQLRKMWGFADPAEMTMMERYQAKYRGCRYSFGYPACPRLEDQTILFDLLRPQDIGVTLTEGFMMEPEASVSAIAIHHPQACYFSVGEI